MKKREERKERSEKEEKTIPVRVRPHQLDHFKRILTILSREYGYLDVSSFGAGKTHITCAIAAHFQLNMIVVCPKSTIPNWTKWTKRYGITTLSIMTYQSLRGQECYKLNHEFLTRIDGSYHATELFEECVRSRLLLVFDEYHNLKNENTQLASAHAMVKSLVRLVRSGEAVARIALLSGTPCVEKESVTSTFKMLGIILSDKLYNYNRSTKEYELVGIQEAITKCNDYDPDETFALTCRSVNKTTAKTICYDLYTRVLKRFVVSSMPPPPITAPKCSTNYYVLMPDKDVERLKRGLMLFKSATNYRHEVQEVTLSEVNWGDVTTSRMEIDSAKIPTVCRLAQRDLVRDPHCKVLIYCNYKRDIVKAAEILSKYDPMIMDGSTSCKKRDEIETKFQMDNDDYRVIISHPKVGGIGMGLDDKSGDRPRIMYILPSYFFVDQYQATGRIHREGTKSKAVIRFVYSRAFPYETGILNSMATKSKILRSMVTEDQKSIMFPGEYGEEIELTPEEIESGKQIDMSRSIDEETEEESEDDYDGPYPEIIKIMKILDRKSRRTDLEGDKYLAYQRFLELIKLIKPEEEGTDEEKLKEIVRDVCRMMYDNVQRRLPDDLQRLAYDFDGTKYNTVDDMVEFIEGFQS